MERKYYKKEALSTLSNIWMREAFIVFVYFLPFLAVELLVPQDETMLVMLSTLLLLPLGFGLTYHYLNLIKGGDSGVSDIFRYYSSGEVFGLMGLTIVVSVFTLLWSLLFIIPGIIASFAYTLATYIKIENPNMDAMECIRTSKEWMKGNKMKLFILELSFIGWFILAGFLVIPLFWVMPYYMLAVTAFYIDIRETADDKEREAYEKEIFE